MIKLESTASVLAVSSVLVLSSRGKEPQIAISVSKANKLENEKWVEDSTKLRQTISFHSEDGPSQISGTVPEADAVEIASCYKVVLQVGLSTRNLPVTQIGRTSRSLASLDVERILEVWSTADKCLWKAPDQAKGRAIDAQGKLVAA